MSRSLVRPLFDGRLDIVTEITAKLGFFFNKVHRYPANGKRQGRLHAAETASDASSTIIGRCA